MKTILSIAAVSLSLVGLAACTGTGSKSAHVAPVKVEGVQGGLVVDAEYIARVERLARIRGVQVQWINPPRKRVTTDQ